MKTVLFATLLSASALATATTNADKLPTHRLHGAWTWTYSKNNCKETYRYRSDNTSEVHSGEELAESRFTIADKPDANGFYRMTDVVTKSNGRTGCDGQPGGTPVGDEATMYVIFHPAREEMLICQEPSLSACMGPLRRVSQ